MDLKQLSSLDDYEDLLYRDCEWCNGTGRNREYRHDRCDSCESEGKVLSNFGEALLKFMKKHLIFQIKE